MGCTRVVLPSGAFAIVCGARLKRPPCSSCGKPAPLLCDWKVDAGTCDAPICASCSTKPAPEKDLCPEHATAWAAWKAAR